MHPLHQYLFFFCVTIAIKCNSFKSLGKTGDVQLRHGYVTVNCYQASATVRMKVPVLYAISVTLIKNKI